MTNDDLEEDIYWPVDGCWDPYELGLKHGREDEFWTEHPPAWFDEDEITDYSDGYREGRHGR